MRRNMYFSKYGVIKYSMPTRNSTVPIKIVIATQVAQTCHEYLKLSWANSVIFLLQYA